MKESLKALEINNLIEVTKNLVSSYLCSEKIGKSSSLNEVKAPLDNIVRNLDYIKEIQQVLEKETLTAKQKSILTLFSYLSVIEGAFSEIANIIVFMLYQSNGLKRTYRQVRQTNLASKMQFLEENGFSAFTRTANRTLRNSIAHLEIVVIDDGSITDVKTNKKIDLKKEMESQKFGLMILFEMQALIKEIRQPTS